MIPCGKFGSPYLGKTATAARAALPVPASVLCSIFFWSFNVHTDDARDIAHGGCTDIGNESTLKADSGKERKKNLFLVTPGNRTLVSIASTNKGVNLRSKYVTQVQQQRPESRTVALTWHARKYKAH